VHHLLLIRLHILYLTRAVYNRWMNVEVWRISALGP
jgi:hypothetical protein